jgi:hypothetical protein
VDEARLRKASHLSGQYAEESRSCGLGEHAIEEQLQLLEGARRDITCSLMQRAPSGEAKMLNVFLRIASLTLNLTAQVESARVSG